MVAFHKIEACPFTEKHDIEYFIAQEILHEDVEEGLANGVLEPDVDASPK
jgi:hypothetical protein